MSFDVYELFLLELQKDLQQRLLVANPCMKIPEHVFGRELEPNFNFLRVEFFSWHGFELLYLQCFQRCNSILQVDYDIILFFNISKVT